MNQMNIFCKIKEFGPTKWTKWIPNDTLYIRYRTIDNSFKNHPVLGLLIAMLEIIPFVHFALTSSWRRLVFAWYHSNPKASHPTDFCAA